MGFVLNILANVAASFVFWVALGIIFWLASRGTRRAFDEFFGLSDGTLTVVLSNAWRRSNSTRPIGFLLSKHETDAALAISSLCNSAPLRLPDVVRGLIDSIWLAKSLRCVIDVSAPDGDTAQAEAASIIVGSARSNSARRHYIESGIAHTSISGELTAKDRSEDEATGLDEVVIRLADGSQQVVKSGMRLGVVEGRGSSASAGKPQFMCAGVRADLTSCSVDYLVGHWKALQQEFRNEPFVVVLGLPRAAAFATEYSNTTVVCKVAL